MLEYAGRVPPMGDGSARVAGQRGSGTKIFNPGEE
jgi:hypothetical protein